MRLGVSYTPGDVRTLTSWFYLETGGLAATVNLCDVYTGFGCRKVFVHV